MKKTLFVIYHSYSRWGHNESSYTSYYETEELQEKYFKLFLEKIYPETHYVYYERTKISASISAKDNKKYRYYLSMGIEHIYVVDENLQLKKDYEISNLMCGKFNKE